LVTAGGSRSRPFVVSRRAKSESACRCCEGQCQRTVTSGDNYITWATCYRYSATLICSRYCSCLLYCCIISTCWQYRRVTTQLVGLTAIGKYRCCYYLPVIGPGTG